MPEAMLDRDGFLILRGVFGPQELAAARALLQRVVRYAERGLEDPFERYYLRHRADQGVLYDLFQRHPEIRAMAAHPRILDALETVLGKDIFLYENSVVYKPKGRRNGVPFHQDFISRPDEPRKLVAWMAIDRVTRTSGALKVIPGSHHKGFLPWERVRGETHHDRIVEGVISTENVHHVELEEGDVLIFNQLLVHGSDEMSTDSLRLVYRASYQGFDEVFVPRGSPIVMRGGSPESLEKRFPQPHEAPRKSTLRAAINKVGRALASL